MTIPLNLSIYCSYHCSRHVEVFCDPWLKCTYRVLFIHSRIRFCFLQVLENWGPLGFSLDALCLIFTSLLTEQFLSSCYHFHHQKYFVMLPFTNSLQNGKWLSISFSFALGDILFKYSQSRTWKAASTQ